MSNISYSGIIISYAVAENANKAGMNRGKKAEKHLEWRMLIFVPSQLRKVLTTK